MQQMRLSSISFNTGNVLRTIQFTLKNGMKSKKFGDVCQVSHTLQLREDAIRRITVFHNTHLMGFRFQYSDGQS